MARLLGQSGEPERRISDEEVRLAIAEAHKLDAQKVALRREPTEHRAEDET